jgi:hypothetical protein
MRNPHSITFDRFVLLARRAHRHFGGRIDHALDTAAHNEMLGLLSGVPTDESDGRLEFFHELTAIAKIASIAVNLYQNGHGDQGNETIFNLARTDAAHQFQE